MLCCGAVAVFAVVALWMGANVNAYGDFRPNPLALQHPNNYPQRPVFPPQRSPPQFPLIPIGVLPPPPRHGECTCPSNTAGVIMLEVLNKWSNYALDGNLLTYNNTAPRRTCAHCGVAHFHHSQGGRIVRQKFCYADSGETVGSSPASPTDAWVMCSNILKHEHSLCVCVIDDNRHHRRNRGRRCFKLRKPSEFEGVGGRTLTSCERGKCRSYWINFKGQELINIDDASDVIRSDNNVNERLSADNDYYLSGETIAVSCRGCEALHQPVCAGALQFPSPPIPPAPTPPVCRTRKRRSADDDDDDDDDDEGSSADDDDDKKDKKKNKKGHKKNKKEHKKKHKKEGGHRRRGGNGRQCARCDECTAGVEIDRFADPAFAIDGGSLSSDVHPASKEKRCGGCRSNQNTLQERCYTEGGSTIGADYLGASFFFVCDKPKDMCVCALKKDGRRDDDGHHKKACYRVTKKGTWGGAAASIVTKCRRRGACENFFVAVDNLELSNGHRTYKGNKNSAELRFDNHHYLHAPKLAVGCRGCKEIEERLECREKKGKNAKH